MSAEYLLEIFTDSLTHALTIGTTMMMIRTTIPTPIMILIFMSFHLQAAEVKVSGGSELE
jgi:hypothetical protein